MSVCERVSAIEAFKSVLREKKPDKSLNKNKRSPVPTCYPGDVLSSSMSLTHPGIAM